MINIEYIKKYFNNLTFLNNANRESGIITITEEDVNELFINAGIDRKLLDNQDTLTSLATDLSKCLTLTIGGKRPNLKAIYIPTETGLIVSFITGDEEAELILEPTSITIIRKGIDNYSYNDYMNKIQKVRHYFINKQGDVIKRNASSYSTTLKTYPILPIEKHLHFSENSFTSPNNPQEVFISYISKSIIQEDIDQLVKLTLKDLDLREVAILIINRLIEKGTPAQEIEYCCQNMPNFQLSLTNK